MFIKPKGKQAEVMALPAKGHMVVLGTAGSGKTTIALLRAYHLASIPNGGKVLIVTFNNALVKYMKEIGSSEYSNIQVESYHKFARGYLNSRGMMPRGRVIASSNEKEDYIEQALDICRKKYPDESTFKRKKEFFIEEITFIERFGFNDFTEYRDAERIGRASANIKRDNRKWVFEVYINYKKIREESGQKYDWDDLSYYVYNELKNDNNERMYKHIIVDEGQDFSPMMIKSLVSAVPEDGSFTFFGDVAQQIYGSRLSWRDSGIDVNKVWKFDINYRNPASITAFAKAITKNKYWHNDRDMIDAINDIAEGPKPALIEFSSQDEEIKWLIRTAIDRSRVSSTVIVCRNRCDVRYLLRLFKGRNCKAVEIDKDTEQVICGKNIYITTYHSVKGLEFENVFIPYLNDEKFPDPDIISSAVSEEEALADEIKLLYVAVTRSKYALYMTFSGTLTPLFPADNDSYDKFDEDSVI